jgi:hypothetical protein
MRLPATNMPRREPEIMARPKPPGGRLLEARCRACDGRGPALLGPCRARSSGKHLLRDVKRDELREVER